MDGQASAAQGAEDDEGAAGRARSDDESGPVGCCAPGCSGGGGKRGGEVRPAERPSDSVTGRVGVLGVLPCEECGRPFECARGDRRYCGPRCYHAAYNRAHPVSRQPRLDFTPAASQLAHAVRGRETRAQRILARLQQGPATSQQLLAVGGLRYGARLLELRRAGHKITTEEHPEYAVYTLEAIR